MRFHKSIGFTPTQSSPTKLNDTSAKNCDLLLIPRGRGIRSAARGRRRRRTRGAVARTRLIRLQSPVIAVLALENITINGREDLIEEAIGRPAAQIAQVRVLPRNDIQYLRQLAIAG